MTDQFPIQRISPLALVYLLPLCGTLANRSVETFRWESIPNLLVASQRCTKAQKNTRTPPRSKDLHVLVEHCETNGKPIPDWHTDLIHIPKTIREKTHNQTHLRHTSLHHNKCATAQGCDASTPAKLLSLALILRGFFGLVQQAVTNK